MKSSEIRELYLDFFEQREHLRLDSASLVPASFDPSVLLTTAGMQPLKPYFLGQEKPPRTRLTSCQKCFRTTDIDEVGNTARHLTFFEMMGNFSIGDYFKEGAIEFAWELSTKGFGLKPDDIWVTVFAGDDELGVGPDDQAVELWRSAGVPTERIVRLPRSDNFWQAGPTGPCGPCSELYLDRGPGFGGDDDRPGDDTERFLEFWNLVFMQYELGGEPAQIAELPSRNIDTGLGLDRMAAILQEVPSVYETDQFKPILELGEELSGRSCGADEKTTRALRILTDHGRALTFLLADGVVPSNEDRGYILRRIMRRAIHQGRVIGIESPFLTKLVERVTEVMGDWYPELHREQATIRRWANAEEEGFSETLEQGVKLLAELVERAKADNTSWIDAADAFKLHDTYGFPYDLTREMLAEEGLSVDDEGFHELMGEQRERARMGTARAQAGSGEHERVQAFIKQADFATKFVGYEDLETRTTIGSLEKSNGKLLAKLVESPFYAEGGGQVADSGRVEADSGKARVDDVYRVGDDQVVSLELESGELAAGVPVRAVVAREARHPTQCNHTATHLLHAALRQIVGDHVRQAGSYVGPDKLRFDFTHSGALGAAQCAEVEDLVNKWILESHPVRALQTTRQRAEELGAMALFGEKYGEWVRLVEVEDVSRELCGGTHVASTAEIGCFKLVTESSSAANVRRIEAITGPEAVTLLRDRDGLLRQIEMSVKAHEQQAATKVQELLEQNRKLEAVARESARGDVEAELEKLIAGATESGGVSVIVARTQVGDADALLELADRIKAKASAAAVVLGAVSDGRPNLVASFSKAAVGRGLSAGEIAKLAAAEMGGGGGGRDNMARAGGKDPEKLDAALEKARIQIKKVLERPPAKDSGR